ncbi:signal peptidase II [candidate division KSB1 bacterium]|nr:signal peptidase II [candidate division KSB1 bacterium]
MRNLNWTAYLTSVFIILLDQVTKILARMHLKGTEFDGGHKTFTVINHVLKLTYIENPGMAFGLRIGNDTFFTICTSITSLVIFYLLYRLKKKQFSIQMALALILAGAIGNLLDRIAYGKVVDFIYIELIKWPVFNIADVAVTIGMIIWITHVFLHYNEPQENVEESEDIWINDEKASSNEIIR